MQSYEKNPILQGISEKLFWKKRMFFDLKVQSDPKVDDTLYVLCLGVNALIQYYGICNCY